MRNENISVDLQWDDADVLPSTVHPDTSFVYHRMTEVTLGMTPAEQGLQVLDVGCGRGADAAMIKEKGATVVGIEPSRIMLDKARDFMTTSGKALHLVMGMSEELPFQTDSFNAVICKGALDHFFDPTKSIHEMHRVLRPRGTAILALANYESLSCKLAKLTQDFLTLAFFRQIQIIPIWEIPPDHTHKFDYFRFMRLVATRFDVVECRGISLLWCYPGWGSLLASLPPNLSTIILHILDNISARLPVISDVIVVKAKPL